MYSYCSIFFICNFFNNSISCLRLYHWIFFQHNSVFPIKIFLEKSIDNFVEKVKSDRLNISDLEGGTFTISNGGVYGSLFATPILNSPQSGILGMHVIQDRPMALNGKVVIRPMMYLSLTYDHRIIDGRHSVQFLKKVKEYLEDPEEMLLEA